MARNGQDFSTPVRRLLIAAIVLFLLAFLGLWLINGPRAERIRQGFTDRFVPSFDWVLTPVTRGAQLLGDLQSYTSLQEQNRELRRELKKMRAWKEAAVQLEQENAKLLAQNNVRLDPALTSISGKVMIDSGTAFRQSVLLNVGADDGIVDGWAVMDGLGLVGRISGVGRQTSRVMLLSDPSSRIPVTISPSGQTGHVSGDNSPLPSLDFVERPDDVRPGDRVVSSGDGGVFPAGLIVGQVALGSDGRLRVRLAADYGRLEILRVLRSHGAERLDSQGALIPPGSAAMFGPVQPLRTPAANGDETP